MIKVTYAYAKNFRKKSKNGNMSPAAYSLEVTTVDCTFYLCPDSSVHF